MAERTIYYKLVGTVVEPCSMMEWARLMESTGDNRTLARETLSNGFHDLLVSTVFLAIDHRFSGGPPLLFETMVFSQGEEVSQTRYATHADAMNGHDCEVQRIVEQQARNLNAS